MITAIARIAVFEELSLVKADFEAIKDIAGHPYEAAVAFYATTTMSGMDKGCMAWSA